MTISQVITGERMKIYTFRANAAVDIEADSEAEAREKFVRAAYDQEENIDYNGMSVYLPSYAELTLEHIEEEN